MRTSALPPAGPPAGAGRPSRSTTEPGPYRGAHIEGRHRPMGARQMPYVATSASDLLARVGGALHLEGERVVIDDLDRLRDDAIRDIAWTAAFTTDDEVATAAQWLPRGGSPGAGGRSAGTPGPYMAGAPGGGCGVAHPGRP